MYLSVALHQLFTGLFLHQFVFWLAYCLFEPHMRCWSMSKKEKEKHFLCHIPAQDEHRACCPDSRLRERAWPGLVIRGTVPIMRWREEPWQIQGSSKGHTSFSLSLSVCVCVCVCVSERGSDRSKASHCFSPLSLITTSLPYRRGN